MLIHRPDIIHLIQNAVSKPAAVRDDHHALLFYRKKYGSASNTSSNFRLTFLLKVVLVNLLFVFGGSADLFQADDWHS